MPYACPPSITVVITAYNIQEYIKTAIDSVLEQNYPDIEILIVDDGSQDDTVDVAINALANYKHCRIIRQDNTGPGGARNMGICSAEAEYILFLDGDDWLAENALSRLTALASTKTHAVFSNRVRYCEKSGRSIDDFVFTSVSSGPVSTGRGLLRRFAVHGKLFRRSFLIDNGILFPELRIWEDYPFSYKVLAAAGCIDVITDVTYVLRRRVEGNPSLTQSNRLADVKLYDRFSQIEMDLDIVNTSGLKKIFPKCDFVRHEFQDRLLVDVKYLLLEKNLDVRFRAFEAIAKFLEKHADSALASVNQSTTEIFNAIINRDLGLTLTLISKYIV